MSSGTHDAWLKRSGTLALVVPLTLIAGCGDPEIAAAPEPPRAAAITIEPALVSLGERAAFTATIADQYGAAYPGTVTWSGSDGAAFAVEAGGLDRAVLTALYSATGGPTWTRRDNWLSAGPLADWYGVQVDTDGRVTSLALFGNNLTGAIPAQVGKLGKLGTGSTCP